MNAILEKKVWLATEEEKLERLQDVKDSDTVSLQESCRIIGVPMARVLPVFNPKGFDRNIRISGKKLKAKGPALIRDFEPHKKEHWTRVASKKADFGSWEETPTAGPLPDVAPIWPRRSEEAKEEARRRLKLLKAEITYPIGWLIDTFGLSSGSLFHFAAGKGVDKVSDMQNTRFMTGEDALKHLPGMIGRIRTIPGGVIKVDGRIRKAIPDSCKGSIPFRIVPEPETSVKGSVTEAAVEALLGQLPRKDADSLLKRVLAKRSDVR